jgi:hypothetical protein
MVMKLTGPTMRAWPFPIVAALLLASGCEDAQDKQQKAEQAQAEADRQRALERQQAGDRTAAAWDAEARQAQQEQAKVDRAWSAAAGAVEEEKRDYSSRINMLMEDIDSRLLDILTSAADGGGASERRLASELTENLTKRRASLVQDQRAMTQVTGDTWPTLRLKIDSDLDDSRSYARTASSRFKAASHR